MSREHEARRVGKGTVLQAGIPKHPVADSTVKANGLLLRGAVTTTYVVDDEHHPHAADDPVAVYCDVLCYSSIASVRRIFVPRALVSQDRGALHSGKVWKPRAATRDITTNAMDLNKGTNLANLDGDHVLVGFLDNSLNLPVILRGIPHPKTDVGQEQEALAGHRLRLKVADGDPDFWKHRGAFYGISDDGDFVADLTQAYDGDLEADGKQPAAPGGGAAGNYKVRLPAGSKLTVEIDGGDNLELDLKDGSAKLKLGDGAVAVAVANHLETLYTTAVTGEKAAHDTHLHPTGTGPSGMATVVFPAWDSNINSNKMEIPDT